MIFQRSTQAGEVFRFVDGGREGVTRANLEPKERRAERQPFCSLLRAGFFGSDETHILHLCCERELNVVVSSSSRIPVPRSRADVADESLLDRPHRGVGEVLLLRAQSTMGGSFGDGDGESEGGEGERDEI